MKARGIVLNSDGSGLIDSCGSPIRLIVTADKGLYIEHTTTAFDNGYTVKKSLTLDSDVVELLAERLKELV